MNQPCVLIVDSDPLFRSLLTSILLGEFRVVTAPDGRQAMQRASEVLLDAVVIEVNTPGQEGMQLLRAFRDHPQLGGARRIVLTTDSSRATVMAAISNGAQDFVLKASLNREEFLKRVRHQVKQANLHRRVAEDLPQSAVRAQASRFDASRVDHGGELQPAKSPGRHAPEEHQDQLLQAIIDNWE
jgi:PleD family two-component response regulator